MQTASSKVTSKGQIVIPKKLREKYGIGPSTRLRWVEKDEGLLLDVASLKARFPMSYADSFAAALARQKEGPLLISYQPSAVSLPPQDLGHIFGSCQLFSLVQCSIIRKTAT